MRNYEIMRSVLLAVKHTKEPISLIDFEGMCEHSDLRDELIRLSDEGLIAQKITSKNYATVKIESLTKEGADFARSIENGEVFAIIHKTLERANVDLSYPLLQEVCTEIVKRYVMSKIPAII